jgi:hypothetical protein
MILRPLTPTAHDAAAPGSKLLPAWDVVQEIQKRKYESCWMITQPSHAALAGDIAARLSGPQFPKLDAGLIRAVAMHDAGWGMPDAQAVQMSRATRGFQPYSFLQMTVAEFLAAWTQSIDIAQTVSPAGGFIVSRHFWRLAEHRLQAAKDPDKDRKQLQGFSAAELQRQTKLAAKQTRPAQELEALTDVLQLCDLLSLYFCSGAEESVELPEFFGVKTQIKVEENGYRLEPAILPSGTEFSVAALRFPPTKEVSGQEINFRIS